MKNNVGIVMRDSYVWRALTCDGLNGQIKGLKTKGLKNYEKMGHPNIYISAAIGRGINPH